jgi:hypothetical protein
LQLDPNSGALKDDFLVVIGVMFFMVLLAGGSRVRCLPLKGVFLNPPHSWISF